MTSHPGAPLMPGRTVYLHTAWNWTTFGRVGNPPRGRVLVSDSSDRATPEPSVPEKRVTAELRAGTRGDWPARRLPLILCVIGAWTVYAVIEGCINWAQATLAGKPSPLTLTVFWGLVDAGLWVLYTPGIVWLALRFPIVGPRRRAHLLLHGVVALTAHVVFKLIYSSLEHRVSPWS